MVFFFFNDTATTEIYTLSLHDALPISAQLSALTPVEQPAITGPATIMAEPRISGIPIFFRLTMSLYPFFIKVRVSSIS